MFNRREHKVKRKGRREYIHFATFAHIFFARFAVHIFLLQIKRRNILFFLLLAMQLLYPQHWKDYELLDCGDFEKLERFGEYITIRPEPQALWDKKLSSNEWEQQAHVRFVPKSSSAGEWKKLKKMPDQWKINYDLRGTNYDLRLKDSPSPVPRPSSLTFRLGLTSFKHVGIFPEQAVNWDTIYSSLKKVQNLKPRFLNLFAYTGGASLAARAAGAEVTHVDSIKQVVTWANENMQLSGLDNIRWVVEDALKFVKREVKRGNQYNGIILDPPAYGHGPNGEKWKLEDSLNEIVKNVYELLDEKEHFLILNAYSLGLSSLIIENLFNSVNRHQSSFETGELYLHSRSGNKLPLGVFGHLSNLR